MKIQAARIALRRKQLSMNQEDLASMIGTSQKQVSKYENGVNDPTGDVLANMAKALETTSDWLLGLTDIMEKPMRDKSDLSEEDTAVINIYHQIPRDDRAKAMDVLRVLAR